MQQDPQIYFRYCKHLAKDHILNLLVETMVTYVLPTLSNCATNTITLIFGLGLGSIHLRWL
jgi:hypothetical protein